MNVDKKDVYKEIYVDVSINDFQEIEKIPNFMHLYNLPKIEEKHVRVWGYSVYEKLVVFYRIKNQEEIIKELVDGFYSIRNRIEGSASLFLKDLITSKDVRNELLPLVEFCNYILKIYNEKKEKQNEL